MIVNAAVEAVGVESAAADAARGTVLEVEPVGAASVLAPQPVAVEEIFCSQCGNRRKLILENGERAKAICPCRKVGAKRRRLSFKQLDR